LRTPARVCDDRLLAAVPWMLLATPLSWNTALILVIPYLITIGARAMRRGSLPPTITMVGAAMVTLGAPIRFAGSFPHSWWQYALYSMPTLGLLLLGLGEWSHKAAGDSNIQPSIRVDVRADAGERTA